ncbi:glycosyl hydrolase (plasmid) [Cupriavidus necator N-1]|uniref:Glycosyl hydrolase n=1 Tax=Cupriavidus necator (strain ATCC 43291 / DSM 13513 / CCUG 52238 / LMG 8453 / N-1) TaxID=1042878 RepID=F8GWX2_CUPNN|nr:YCF48-related protein [Cupriavidus necator]AEI81842.1 glycosyl hydrolase [Cupriavidus necator N-1]MDX6008169.1 YCF48-related protein [Cupriavidus necator]
MNRPFRVLAICLACALPFTANAFQNPLSLPSKTIPHPDQAPMFAIAQAGSRTVSVGRHGVIAYQDRNGKAWRQAKVPVSSDLVGVSFVDERMGWAVGHGGVVLHSADGGATWAKQLDGKDAGQAALAYYRKHADDLGPENRDTVLKQAARWAEEATAQPFLDVWFKNESTGYIVGSFNRIMRTDDGGKQWIPLIDKIDNPGELHFYTVRGNGDDVYIAGESGSVWRWDEHKGKFILVKTPYDGSLFGLVLAGRAVLAYGMRGSLFRTFDRGASWEKIKTDVRGGIVAGDVSQTGEIIVASQSGDILRSSDNGGSFARAADPLPTAVAGLLAFPTGAYVTVGPRGVRTGESANRVPQSR